MSRLNIIKIGGAILEDEAKLATFVDNVSRMEGKKIIVHGGGRTASSTSEKLGIQPTLIEGRRVTDKSTLEVVVMVYAGLLNKKLVASLQHCGVNALGLSGADLNCILAFKREVKSIDYGFVGDIEIVNDEAISDLLERGISPVFCALTHDGEGQLLNTNADTIASMLSEALSPHHDVHLYFCFEKPGVLRDSEDDDSLIEILDHAEFQRMKLSGDIHLGMIPKLDNAFYAVLNGAKRVYVCHVDALADLENLIGTQIC